MAATLAHPRRHHTHPHHLPPIITTHTPSLPQAAAESLWQPQMHLLTETIISTLSSFHSSSRHNPTATTASPQSP
ncbi:hypothetical protein Tco_0589948 [Tanacetum coccineum]